MIKSDIDFLFSNLVYTKLTIDFSHSFMVSPLTPKKNNTFSHGKSGFTLLDLLITVVIISVVAVVVFVAIDPLKRFAEGRNSRRTRDIYAIANAVSLYFIDNKNTASLNNLGIDGAYRMLGTATSGCDLTCNVPPVAHNNPSQNIASSIRKALESLFQVEAAPEEPKLKPVDTPQILAASTNTLKVVPGDMLNVEVEVSDPSGIESVTADMGGIETISLKLHKGTITRGTWKTDWLVHDTIQKAYTTIITVVNKKGVSAQKKLNWSDPTGWTLPTGYSDPGNQWTTETNAYDNNVGTYATNTYGGTGWGQFFIVTLSTPITSDRLRLMVDYLDSDIQEVDVDVYKDGAWTDVYQGGSEAVWNGRWVELTFPKGQVSQARFRYNYRVGGYNYWMYEFQLYQANATVVLPTCGSSSTVSLRSNSVILQDHVADDGGEVDEYRFSYGTTTSYGSATTWTGSKATGDSFGSFVTGLDENTTYHFRGELRNSAGTAVCTDGTFTTTVEGNGWVYPTSGSDSSSGWENGYLAFDDSLSTFAQAYHPINSDQWSQFFVMNHPAMTADKIRFKGLAGSEVSQVDIDVYKDGAWVDAYQGTFPDQTLSELSFTSGTVTQARIRFYATTASHGFYFQLYDFTFDKTADAGGVGVYDSSCLNLSTPLAPYLKTIPFDPQVGSDAKTYYLIKRDTNKIITVVACGSELDQSIIVHKD